jgi:hypothetical protein
MVLEHELVRLQEEKQAEEQRRMRTSLTSNKRESSQGSFKQIRSFLGRQLMKATRDMY